MERQPGGGYKYVKRTEFYGGCSLDDVSVNIKTPVWPLLDDNAPNCTAALHESHRHCTAADGCLPQCTIICFLNHTIDLESCMVCYCLFINSAANFCCCPASATFGRSISLSAQHSSRATSALLSSVTLLLQASACMQTRLRPTGVNECTSLW